MTCAGPHPTGGGVNFVTDRLVLDPGSGLRASSQLEAVFLVFVHSAEITDPYRPQERLPGLRMPNR